MILPKTKYVFWLLLDHRRAVVIAWSRGEAKQIAKLTDPSMAYRNWEDAQVTVICPVRRSRTSMVLAMDGK